ncbi:hypothetical protein QUF50_08690 [Thiotrichales bacterium HSG1]|nr:hypothetical protein [Thiotrichales bacterium HSG1]
MTEEATNSEATNSRAWLLNFGSGLQAAVGHHEMWQVLISHKLFNVPVTLPYCNEVLIFQSQILPVVDMSMLMEGKKLTQTTDSIVGITVYQKDPSQPVQYACLHLATMPQNIYVDDEQECELPVQQKHWKPFTSCCFLYKNTAIPIINLAYLFSEQFRKSLL